MSGTSSGVQSERVKLSGAILASLREVKRRMGIVTSGFVYQMR
jgi:hypothetical protein